MGILGDAWGSVDSVMGGTPSEAGGFLTGDFVDFLAGGGQTDVAKYDQWDEEQMRRNREAQQAARSNQQWLGQQYRDQIMGNGPSVAQNQLREATNQNMQNQMSMARSGTGPLGNAAAQNSAMNNMAYTNQMANREAATMRAQEQLGAMQNYGQLAGQTRGQDIDMFGGEAAYQKAKADSWNSAEQARAQAEEGWKTRRGSGVAGGASALMSVFGA